MSSEERLKFMGRLQEKKLKLEELELKMKGLIVASRNLLDPFERLEKLKLNLHAQNAVELVKLQIDYRACKDEIESIQEALGL